MESFLIRPVRRTGDQVGQPSQQHESEVHHEARPDDEFGATIAPHFRDAVVDYIRDGKHEHTRRQVQRSELDLFGCQEVCQNQANAERDAEQHEGHAHRFLFIIHFPCFVKGGGLGYPCV